MNVILFAMVIFELVNKLYFKFSGGFLKFFIERVFCTFTFIVINGDYIMVAVFSVDWDSYLF